MSEQDQEMLLGQLLAVQSVLVGPHVLLGA
jgi:hypothetical protein